MLGRTRSRTVSGSRRRASARPHPEPVAERSISAPSPRPVSLVGVAHRLDDIGEHAADRLRGRHAFDLLFYGASAAGEHSALWIALALLSALRGRRQSARRAVIGLVAESLLVNGVLKSFIGRRRPSPIRHADLPLRMPRTSSFPSGHASAAAFAVLVLGEDDPLQPLYLAAAAVVAASRLYVRLHHLSDVVGGLVVGTVLGRLFRRLYPLARPSAPHGDPPDRTGRELVDGH